MKQKKALLSDEQLIRNYLSGDSDCLGQLYQGYYQKVLYKCFSFTKNTDEAYDLAQEILLKAFDKLETFRFDSSFATWLYRIAQNHCIEYFRKHKRIVFEEISSYESEYEPDEIQDETDQQQNREVQLHLAMEKLSDGERAILMMKYLEGNSILDLQQFFHLSASAVKMRLQRAKQKVEKQIQFHAEMV